MGKQGPLLSTQFILLRKSGLGEAGVTCVEITHVIVLLHRHRNPSRFNVSLAHLLNQHSQQNQFSFKTNEYCKSLQTQKSHWEHNLNSSEMKGLLKLYSKIVVFWLEHTVDHRVRCWCKNFGDFKNVEKYNVISNTLVYS